MPYRKNMGRVEQAARFGMGIVIALVGYFAPTTALQVLLAVPAAILLATGVSGFCPWKRLLGLGKQHGKPPVIKGREPERSHRIDAAERGLDFPADGTPRAT